MDDMECLEENDDVYYLRGVTKRRRLVNKNVNTSYSSENSYRRKVPIALMPTEVLEKVFSYISYEDLAKTVRLVNRRFRLIVQHILNVAFKKMEAKTLKTKNTITRYLEKSKMDADIKYMCKMLNIAETLVFQHSLIISTVWRYINNKYQSTNLCMYGGAIIDLFNKALHCINPEKSIQIDIIEDETSANAYLHVICYNVKMFVLHFDRVSETPKNHSVFISGCKMLDILDCATQAQCQTIEECINEDKVKLKIKYNFRHAWFVALDLSEGKPKSWNEEQRLMYMRLRRIVMSHTEMKIEYEQYKRERNLRNHHLEGLKKPINSVYTGYGEVGRKFFFYGVMNRGAYAVKFEHTRALYALVENEDDDDNNVNNLENHKPGMIPFLGLDIFVELECPTALAPRKVIEGLEEKNNGVLSQKQILPKKLKGFFNMKVKFSCKSAKYPRLPDFYEVELKGRRF